MRNFFYTISLFFASVIMLSTGCEKSESFDTSISWDIKPRWKADDFFDDPKVIALCKAIEAKDLKEIDRLVAEGADVNTKGKGNMTPLLWAFPENKPDIFKRILEHGADPNVIISSDFGTKFGKIQPGDSVLYHATRTEFPNYFKYVMQHGGNPNLITRHGLAQFSPLMTVMAGFYPDKKESIQLLIDTGADLDYRTDTGSTALYTSISGGHYSITLLLLEAGASYNHCRGNHNMQTVLHFLVGEMSDVTPPEEKENYAKVLAWLEVNGADLEGARKDRATWARGGNQSPARIAELKKRYEDELAAKEKKAANGQ